MSIAIHATLLTGGHVIARPGRGRQVAVRTFVHKPIEIVIDHLTRRGCRISADLRLPVDEPVTVGLPGVGVRPAYVSGRSEGNINLVFQQALTGRDIDLAEENASIAAHAANSAIRTVDGRLSPICRIGVVAATAILGWCLAIVLYWLVTGLV